MNKELKYFIQSLFIFIPIAMITYVIMICLWGDYAPSILKKNLNYRIGSYGHMFTRLNEVKKINNVDILFLGSSHVYRGFDPRIFKEEGYQIFNLGSSSQTPIQTYLLLKKYLDQLNPKLVIYDAYPNSFIYEGVESSLDIIANDDNDWETLNMALQIKNTKTTNTLIYSYYQDILEKNNDFKEDKIRNEDTYISGGFVEKEIQYYKHEKKSEKKWDWKWNKNQMNSFKKILKLLEDKNTPIILIQTPITSGLYNSYSNIDIFNKKINSYGSYYNFNDFIKLDDSLHFYDAHHLNQDGVKIMNQKMIEIIQQDYPLK